jgi:hypothetical protein
MIRFFRIVNVEIIDIDKNGNTVKVEKVTFTPNEWVQARITKEWPQSGFVTLTFGDGGVAKNIHKCLFEIA